MKVHKMKAKVKQQKIKRPVGRPPVHSLSRYDNDFKRTVVLFAEQKSTSEARRRFGVSDSNIRRWRKLKNAAASDKAKPLLEAKLAGHGKKGKVKRGIRNVPSTLDSMPLEQRLKAPSTSSAMPPSDSLISSSIGPPAAPAPAPIPEPVLHSQPLSPTKLKVTRHARPPTTPAKVGGPGSGTVPHQQSPRLSGPPPTPPPPSPQQPPPQPHHQQQLPTPTPVGDICLRWNSHHSNIQTTFPSLLLREQYVDATLVAEGKTIKCHRVILSSCSPYFEDILASISPYQHPVLFMKDTPFWIIKCVCDFMYSGEVNVAQNKLEEFLAAADSLKVKGLSKSIDYPVIPDIKNELEVKPIKEEQKEEKELLKELIKEPSETRETTKEQKEIKAKEPKDTRVGKAKKRHHVSPPAPTEMPVLKSAKLLRSAPQPREMPILKSSKVSTRITAKIPRAKIIPKRIEKVEKKVEKPDKRVEKIDKEVEKKLEKPEKRIQKLEKRIDKAEKKVEKPEKKSEKSEKPPKESPSSSKIFDPFNLLKPVYEEVTKQPKGQSSFAKVKEPKPVPGKKHVTKKMKKRKVLDRDESPPPVLSKKGTRSRPNRKVAKFYHSPYERPTKRTTVPLKQIKTNIRELAPMEVSTIIREPHTDQADPLMQYEEIKAEPVDVEENAIDIVDNVVSYCGPEEEINFKLMSQPVIMDVRSMAKSVKLVNVDEIKGLKQVDPLTFNPVQNYTEKEDSSTSNELGFKISEVVSAAGQAEGKVIKQEKKCYRDLEFKISNVVSKARSSPVIGSSQEITTHSPIEETSQDSIHEKVDISRLSAEVTHHEIDKVVVKANVLSSAEETNQALDDSELNERKLLMEEDPSDQVNKVTEGSVEETLDASEEEVLDKFNDAQREQLVEATSRTGDIIESSAECTTVASSDTVHETDEASTALTEELTTHAASASTELTEEVTIHAISADKHCLGSDVALPIEKDEEEKKMDANVADKLTDSADATVGEQCLEREKDEIGELMKCIGDEDANEDYLKSNAELTIEKDTGDADTDVSEKATDATDTTTDEPILESEEFMQTGVTNEKGELMEGAGAVGADEEHLNSNTAFLIRKDDDFRSNVNMTEKVADAADAATDPQHLKIDELVSKEDNKKCEFTEAAAAEDTHKRFECEEGVSTEEAVESVANTTAEQADGETISLEKVRPDDVASCVTVEGNDGQPLDTEESDEHQTTVDGADNECFETNEIIMTEAADIVIEQVDDACLKRDEARSSEIHASHELTTHVAVEDPSSEPSAIKQDISQDNLESGAMASTEEAEYSDVTTSEATAVVDGQEDWNQNVETATVVTSINTGGDRQREALIEETVDVSQSVNESCIDQHSLESNKTVSKKDEAEGFAEVTSSDIESHIKCTGKHASTSQHDEPMDAQQIGDLLTMNTERLTVEDQTMEELKLEDTSPMEIEDFLEDQKMGESSSLELNNVNSKKTDLVASSITSGDELACDLPENQEDISDKFVKEQIQDAAIPSDNMEEQFDQNIISQSTELPCTSGDVDVPQVTDSSYYTIDQKGCEGENEIETEDCKDSNVIRTEFGDDEYDKKLLMTSTDEDATVPESQSEKDSLPGFHIEQVVNQQIALHEENRVDTADCSSLKDDLQGTSDLESIVNDLSRIVGNSESHATGELQERGEDDTNVIAESLENLLEK